MYQAILPRAEHLPDARQRLWIYFKLWPNVAFDIYPDQVDFMQMIPISPTETLIREIAYAHPDGRREMRAARYLNWRINRAVSVLDKVLQRGELALQELVQTASTTGQTLRRLEDKGLIDRVQTGMGSRSFSPGPLGRNEVSLRSFAHRMRELIPESRLDRAPPPGWLQRHDMRIPRG